MIIMQLLFCTLPPIINLSALPIVDIDYRARKAAERTCKSYYKSCLTKFYKTDFQAYRAVCNGNEFRMSCVNSECV